MNSSTQKIIDALDKSELKQAKIEIKCKIKNIEFKVKNKDIMGSLIQSWLERFLTENNIKWREEGTQEYPDFILDNDEYLEVKCYFKNASPAFDIANFSALINDLPVNPKRLDSDYLIFSYGFDENGATLNNYWVKKIWEMSNAPTSHKKNKIRAQVTRGVIKNIRPTNFTKNPDNCFSSRLSFVNALKETIDAFSNQTITGDSKFKNGDDWFAMVTKKYEEQTNKVL